MNNNLGAISAQVEWGEGEGGRGKEHGQGKRPVPAVGAVS